MAFSKLIFAAKNIHLLQQHMQQLAMSKTTSSEKIGQNSGF